MSLLLPQRERVGGISLTLLCASIISKKKSLVSTFFYDGAKKGGGGGEGSSAREPADSRRGEGEVSLYDQRGRAYALWRA